MNKLEGKENVFDVIDDAAQVLFKMAEGIYRDELNNVMVIIKSGNATTMVLGDEDFKFIVECIEEDDHTGKITSVSLQSKDKKIEFYTAKGIIFRYDNGIRGERGRLMMHRLIKKLQTCMPEQQHGIRMSVMNAIARLPTSLLHSNVEGTDL